MSRTKRSVPKRSALENRQGGVEPDYLEMSRKWAAKHGHPDNLTAEQFAACVSILRPSLLAIAQERRASRHRPETAA